MVPLLPSLTSFGLRRSSRTASHALGAALAAVFRVCVSGEPYSARTPTGLACPVGMRPRCPVWLTAAMAEAHLASPARSLCSVDDSSSKLPLLGLLCVVETERRVWSVLSD